MPTAIIIAGPNGAGKTTFADRYLSREEARFEFVNADEIARGLTARGVLTGSDVAAGRAMLNRIDELVSRNADFALETTLATLTYAQKFQSGGTRATSSPWRICVSAQLTNRSAVSADRWQPAGTESRKKQFAADLERVFDTSKPSTNRSWMSGIFGTAEKGPLNLSSLEKGLTDEPRT